MPRGKSNGGKLSKRPIERYEHKDKKRINNPPVGLVTPETDPPLPTHRVYDYIPPVPSCRVTSKPSLRLLTEGLPTNQPRSVLNRVTL
jgi:hypothetical protein